MEEKKLTINKKRDISYNLLVYVKTFSTQKRACASLAGVSEATVIAMLSQEEFGWDKISDDMWRNAEAQIGNPSTFSKLVKTRNFKALTSWYNLAKEEGASFAITGEAGWGKSYTAQWYASINRKNDVYLLECAEYLNRKTFLALLLMQMGYLNFGNMSLNDMMDIVIREIRKADHPLFIWDEIDKLPDGVFKFFITFYNKTNKKCGHVWQSTNAIERRMHRGIDTGVIGYKELFSRIGAQFIHLSQPTRDEIEDICEINGITGKEQVAMICNEVLEVGGDLRRVDRNLLKHKVKTKKAA